MSSEIQTTKNNKIELSLAAVMFFAPLIKKMLKTAHLELNDQDKEFIEGYIKFGYLSIGGLLLAIGSGVVLYLSDSATLQRIYTISSTLLIIILITGIVGVLGNLTFFQKERGFIHTEEIQTDKGNIFLSYLPIYNIFLRYKLHDFSKPYWRVKESILARTLFFIVTLCTQNNILSGLVLIFIIIRIAGLLSGLDFIDNTIKTKLNKLFTKNPEELRGYVSGTFLYIWNNITDKSHTTQVQTYIDQQKNHYQELEVLKNNKKIIAEYCMLILGIIGLGYQIQITANMWIPISIIIFLVGRYGIMLTKRKHTVHIPVMREIVLGVTILRTKLFRKKNKIGEK